MNHKFVTILSVRINTYNFPETIQKIKQFLSSPSRHYAVTPNPEIILLASQDKQLLEIINQSDLSCADGSGLLWAAKFQQIPLNTIPVLRSLQAIWQMIYSLIFFAFYQKYAQVIPERVTGTDLVPEIAKLCAENQKSIFFLGAGPDIALKTSERLSAINPNLIVAGTSSGHHQSQYDEANVKMINKSQADCLLLAFGAPNDQRWIARNLSQLNTVKFVIGVGGAFDFIAEEVSILGGRKAVRAPQWLRTLHLEWLHRLYNQPHRLIRILRAIFVFPVKVMIAKINDK